MRDSVDHANICSVYEFGEHDSQPFMVMQFLEGCTLRDHLAAVSDNPEVGKPSTLPFPRLLDLAIQTCQGLEAAHEEGIIHRDIKPANIFMTSKGVVKILDFGLAKLAAAANEAETVVAKEEDRARAKILNVPLVEHSLTRTGVAAGTGGYMSPEQLRGDPLDVRTDLFSFGVVLYEMATGIPPFSGDTTEIVYDSILHRTPVPPLRLNQNLPPALEQIIKKALEKDRDARYQSASEIYADLKPLESNFHSVETEALPESSGLWSKLSRAWVLLCLAGIILFVAALFIPKFRQIYTPQRLQLLQRELTANSADNAVIRAVISPDGKQLAYDDRENGLSLLQIDTGERRIILNTGSLEPEAWFPDGAHLFVSGVGTGGGWVVSTIDGTRKKILDEAINFQSARVSPDGTQIAFNPDTHPGEIWVMGADGENLHRILSVEPFVTLALAWSPTSRRIVYSRMKEHGRLEDASLESCDRDGGECAVILSEMRLEERGQASGGRRDMPGGLLWSADGRVFYTLREPAPNEAHGAIWSISVDPDTGQAHGEPRQVTSWTGFYPFQFSESADGKRFAFLSFHSPTSTQVAEIMSDGRLGPSEPLHGDNWDKFVSAWTSDSRAVVFASDPQGKWGIFKQDVQTHKTQILVSGPDSYIDPVVSPDGQWLLFTQVSPNDLQGSSARLMRMRMEGGPTSVVLPGSFTYRCAYQASICILSEVNGNRRVFSVVDPLRGREEDLAEADPPPDDSRWSISPDGKSIAFVPLYGGNNGNQIQIINTFDRSTHSIVLRDLHLKASHLQLQSVSWAPDNKHLYASAWTGSSFTISRVSLDGDVAALLEMPDMQKWLFGPKPSPDGHYLAYLLTNLETNVTMLENY